MKKVTSSLHLVKKKINNREVSFARWQRPRRGAYNFELMGYYF
jgi:hypothetical protein